MKCYPDIILILSHLWHILSCEVKEKWKAQNIVKVTLIIPVLKTVVDDNTNILTLDKPIQIVFF